VLSQPPNGVDTLALGDEHHLALFGIGGNRQVVVSTPLGGLADGQAVTSDSLAAARSTWRAQIACTRCHDSPTVRASAAKGISRYQRDDQSLKQRREARKPPARSGSTKQILPSGWRQARGMRPSIE
jgi:hypothetical protein